jgi:hypothetical protein
MKSGGIGKHIAGALVLAVAVYVGGFGLDQHLRTRRGPWQVTFIREDSGTPALIINQPRLNIANLKIIFGGEQVTNSTETVVFDFPKKRVPFGKVKFEDLTYLPGTVTLELFGHEVELLPRTLYLNRQPHSWKSGEIITLRSEDKPASLPEPDPRKKRYK